MKNEAIIYGTKGFITFPEFSTGQRFTTFKHEGTNEIKDTIDVLEKNHDNGFIYQVEEVARCIQEGKLESNIIPLNETIGVNGRTNFPDITADNLGDTLNIGLEAEGWEIVDRNEIYVFDGEPITIRVRRNQSLGIIKGVVMSRDGQDFIANAEILVGADTLIYSNSFGQFKTVLPNSIRVADTSDFYKLTISKKGFKAKTEICYPNTFIEVRLDEK